MILAKLSRWLLIVACLFEGSYFLVITYVLFRFEIAFKAQWLQSSLMSTIAFTCVGVLFFYAAYLVFSRRSWARYLAALLLSGELIWIFVDTFSEREWLELLWAAPLAVAIACLMYVWQKREFWNLKEVA